MRGKGQVDGFYRVTVPRRVQEGWRGYYTQANSTQSHGPELNPYATQSF